MARSLTIHSIDRQADRVYLRFGADRSEIEIPISTAAELREWVRRKLDESDETILALALACWMARDANLTNPAQIVGRTITLNLAGRFDLANAIFRVQ